MLHGEVLCKATFTLSRVRVRILLIVNEFVRIQTAAVHINTSPVLLQVTHEFHSHKQFLRF